MTLAQLRLVDTVDLSNLDRFLLQGGGSFLVFGCQSFAVTTPEQQQI